jgi:stage V sporulation protein G
MTAFIFSLISMRKEHQFGSPLKGIVWFTLGIVCLCAVVLLADSLKAYAFICFDDCFLVHDIRVIKGPTGLFISFPNVTESDGTQPDIAFPVNAETRNMIEQAVLEEYEKIVAGSR